MEGLLKRDVEVFAAGRPRSEFVKRHESLLGDRLYTVPLRNEIDLFSVNTLAGIIKRHGIDIIHAHTSHAHTLACLIRTFSGKSKVIVSRRVDFVPKSKWINQKKYSWPDHYVAISNAIKKILVEFGVSDGRLSMVHSAIDPIRFNVRPVERDEFGIAQNAFVWGNVGNLVGHKDHATLIRGFGEVVKKNANTVLCIVGPGPLRSELKQLSDELGLEDHVKFLGYRDDVPNLLKMFDGFVMSSKEEGLGTSVLDAMASGLPVVGTSAGGIPEMVKDKQTGLLAETQNPLQLGAKMLEMMSQKDLRASVVERATQMIEEEYLVDRMVDGNLAVYNAVLNDN